MNLIRYQTPQRNHPAFTPLSRLSAFQNEVDRLFALPFFGADTRTVGGFSPALDVYQDGENLTVVAEAPGMKREDFHLTLHDGTLSISGERKLEKAHDEQGALRNEREFGAFERTITLPFAVDANRVSATYQDGVLTVTLAKAEEAKPRQIEIK